MSCKGPDAARASRSSSPDAFYDAEMASLDNVSVLDLGTSAEPEVKDVISSPASETPAAASSQLVSLHELQRQNQSKLSVDILGDADRSGSASPDGQVNLSIQHAEHLSNAALRTSLADRSSNKDVVGSQGDECTRLIANTSLANTSLADAQQTITSAFSTSNASSNPRTDRNSSIPINTETTTNSTGLKSSIFPVPAELQAREKDSSSPKQVLDAMDASAPESSHAEPSSSRDLAFSMKLDGQESNVTRSRRATHGEEDDSWDSWQRHKRHFFILNSAGKPVFSRYGDENMLAGFMAIIQAIISVVQDQGDNLRHIQAGRHLIVVLVKGPLYLVAVSCVGEPVAALNKQLQLLYNQVIFIVTSSIERVIIRNPGYDARGLLGGTCSVLTTLLKSFSQDPTYLLEANKTLPLPVPERKAVCDALQEAVKASGAMYGLLLAEGLLVGVERLKHPPLHPLDLLLLINFVRSNDATYRYRFGESFSPLCLPHFQPSAFLHAYIRYLHADAGICLVLLSASSDAFYQLSEQRQHMEGVLGLSGLLHSLVTRVSSPGAGQLQLDQLPRVAGGGPVGSTSLWHFMMKIPSRRQVITPAIRDPLTDSQILKRVVRAYARQHTTVWDSPLPGVKPHRLHWHMDNNWVMLASIDRDYELYVVFDPLVTKEEAARISDQLRRFFMDKQRLQEFVLP